MDYKQLLATVFITGFAIQQILQRFDGVIDLLFSLVNSDSCKCCKFLRYLFASKRSFMGFLSTLLGYGVVKMTRISLLAYIVKDSKELDKLTLLDNFLTAFVVGAGTEGMNTLIKYIGYVKEGRASLSSAILVRPANVTLVAGSQFQFLPSVPDLSDLPVEWRVLQRDASDPQKAAADITAEGVFTAPSSVGTYHVAVISKANPDKSAVATVTVKAA